MEILNNQQKMLEFISKPETLLWLIPLIVIVLVLKLICLWKTARNNQIGWFIALGLINTVGLLEIIYLIFFTKEEDI